MPKIVGAVIPTMRCSLVPQLLLACTYFARITKPIAQPTKHAGQRIILGHKNST
jgi:hypothetical protein